MEETEVFELRAFRNGHDEPAIMYEVAKVSTPARRRGTVPYIVRRLDCDAPVHLIEVDEDDGAEQIIAKAMCALVGLRLAKPRAPKAAE